mgnify:CR=1 FL=1
MILRGISLVFCSLFLCMVAPDCYAEETHLQTNILRFRNQGGFYDKPTDKYLWVLPTENPKAIYVSGRLLSKESTNVYLNNLDSPSNRKKIYDIQWAGRGRNTGASRTIFDKGFPQQKPTAKKAAKTTETQQQKHTAKKATKQATKNITVYSLKGYPDLENHWLS